MILLHEEGLLFSSISMILLVNSLSDWWLWILFWSKKLPLRLCWRTVTLLAHATVVLLLQVDQIFSPCDEQWKIYFRGKRKEWLVSVIIQNRVRKVAKVVVELGGDRLFLKLHRIYHCGVSAFLLDLKKWDNVLTSCYFILKVNRMRQRYGRFLSYMASWIPLSWNVLLTLMHIIQRLNGEFVFSHCKLFGAGTFILKKTCTSENFSLSRWWSKRKEKCTIHYFTLAQAWKGKEGFGKSIICIFLWLVWCRVPSSNPSCIQNQQTKAYHFPCI